jgi:tetratricopeptide (TPR) repeat protein
MEFLKQKYYSLPHLVILVAALTMISACSNVDPNQGNSIFTGHWPVSTRTYDDFMEAAHEKVTSGDTEAAIAMYRKAVETAKSEYGPTDLRIATSASYLASYYVSLGLFGEAEIYYKKALAVDLASLGPQNPETVRIRTALADVLVKLYKVDEANKLLHESKSDSNNRTNKR